MKTIRIKIKYPEDRETMLVVLDNNGYKTWIEKGIDCTGMVDEKIYWVCFEIKE